MDKRLIEKIVNNAYYNPPAYKAAYELYCKGATEAEVLKTTSLPEPWRVEVANVMREINRIVMSKM